MDKNKYRQIIIISHGFNGYQLPIAIDCYWQFTRIDNSQKNFFIDCFQLAKMN